MASTTSKVTKTAVAPAAAGHSAATLDALRGRGEDLAPRRARASARAGRVDEGAGRRWVGGLSPAATGFASASAPRLSDAWTLQRLLDTVELAVFSLELGDREDQGVHEIALPPRLRSNFPLEPTPSHLTQWPDSATEPPREASDTNSR